MTPQRFCTEIPHRITRLLDAMLPIAQRQDLTTSMALMAAMPLLLIPLERTKKGPAANAMNDVQEARSFVRALSKLKKKSSTKSFFSAQNN